MAHFTFRKWLTEALPRSSRSRRGYRSRLRLDVLEDRTTPATWRVSAVATGADTGLSWGDAFPSLQSALAAAGSGDEIWVAAATYKPTSGTDRSATFDLKSGVAVYGGFAGTETAREQRNWAANVTILSGAIGTPAAADNSYHVLRASGQTGVVVDGFTVTGGYASAVGTEEAIGGGFYNTSGSSTVSHMTFRDNYAYHGGGGVGNNTATLTLTDSLIVNNSARYGGGLWVDFNASATATNVTIVGNTSEVNYGGVLVATGSTLALTNALVWGNAGTQIANWSGGASATYSDVQGGWAGTGNLNADPLFLNAAGGDYRLQTGSPVIDVGTNAGATPTDLDGLPRPTDGDGNGSAVADMGAHEFSPTQVTTLVDAVAADGRTSLREAITYANSHAGLDTVTFAPNLTGTVTLTGGVLTLTDNVSVRGPGSGLLTISGNDTSQIFTMNAFQKSAAVSGLTLTHGYAADGGAISTANPMTLFDVVVTNNHATHGGGGIYNMSGTMTLDRCTISDNLADYEAGGVYNYFGTLTVSNSVVTGNTGGNYGGGLWNNKVMTVENTTVAGNSTLYYGGGIYSRDSVGGAGSLSLRNVSVSNNQVTGQVGGVTRQGGGVDIESGLATVGNTIVAGNRNLFLGVSDDLYGAANLSGSGNNLLGDGTGSNLTNGVQGNLVGSAGAPLNPLLAPLGAYGGPTQTLALLPGSPAIDTGTSTGAPTTDQRGVGRVGFVDMGAFESGGFTITSSSGGGQLATVTTAFAAPLAVTVAANNAGEPVQGGRVTFMAPPSGASAVLTGNPATVAAGGMASVTATANGTIGAYGVSATATGITTPATFSLANTPPDVSVAVAPSSVLEDGAANLVYTFTRSGVTTGVMTVNFSVGGSASFGTDYTQSGAATFTTAAGTVTFAPGNTTATVTIDPVPDLTVESNETATLTVTAGTGYNVASPGAATGTIANEDFGPPILTSVLVNNTSASSSALTNSRVTSLVLNFNMAVNLDPGAFSLTNGVSTITSNAGGAVSTSGGGTSTVTLTFTGSSGVDFTSLADGVWTLSTDMTKLRAVSNNQAGTGTTTTTSIRRLYGDIDSNGVVNSDDFDQFGNTFGLVTGDPGYLASFDFDDNGVINSDDFDQFGNRFGVAL